MEYDKRDKLIIEALYHNWRASSSQLSRSVHLSRRKVDYRIKNYFSSGTIRAIFTVFNYPSLGFSNLTYAFIRLNNKRKAEDIGHYIDKTGRCTSWGRAWTEYDLFVNLIFKTLWEKNLFFKKLYHKFGKSISKIMIVNPTHSEFYPLKSIDNNENETYLLTERIMKNVSIDKIDIALMKSIASDARAPVVEISEKIGISPERCLYRLRRLVKEKVILGSRIQFGLKKAGYFATCLFIETKLEKSIISKVRSLCKENANINYLIISKVNPQIIIQVFHQNEEELSDVIKKLNDLIGDNFVKISLVKLEDDINIINPLPFLR